MSLLTKMSRRGLAGICISALAGVAVVAPAHAGIPGSASSYFANFETGNSNVSTSQFFQTGAGIQPSLMAEHPGNVYAFQTNNACTAGFKMTTAGMLFTSTQHPVVKMDVYSPEAASINIKVERASNGAIKAAKLVRLTAGWNLDVSVDFSTVSGWDPANDYDVLTIFPGFSCNQTNGGSASQTYYVDNIQANGGDKPTPTIASAPTASDITYGQTLADSTLSGGTASVDGSFAFTTPSTAPNAGTANQAVTFTPTDTHNYRNATTSTSVNVEKAKPTILTNPTASDITYRDSLGNSNLSGGTASVSGSFVFTSPTTQPNAGTADYEVQFVPDDSDNFETVTLSDKVSLTTNKANFIAFGANGTNITYGQSLADSTLSGSGCALDPFGSNPVPCTYNWEDSTIVPNAGMGQSFKVKYVADDSANYADQTIDSYNFDVLKATPTISSQPTAADIQYGKTLGDSVLTGGLASVPGSFAFASATYVPTLGSNNYTVIFTPTDSSNYEPVSIFVSVNVVGPWIKSVKRQGLWSYVDFTLPDLSAGKRYDRVAYRINGGAWVNWGVFSKSAQKLTGIKAKRNYTVQIRAHVNKGAWTGASNVVSFYSGNQVG